MMQPKGELRGGLISRWKEAKLLGCGFIEVPANFIKNANEERITGIGVTQIPTKEAIDSLYIHTGTVPDELKYIMHTEPSFPLEDANGVTQPAANLKWHDKDWVNRFTQMLIMISERLGKPASIIELHPGSNDSVTMKDIACSIKAIREMYGDHFGGLYPAIVLENRNRSIIENGQQLSELWTAMNQHVPELCNTCGIVLDFSVLFNVTRRRKESFQEYIDAVPVDGIKGVHVHTFHDAPSRDDPVPWDSAFKKVREIPHEFFINTEIHHKNKVRESIKFCEDFYNK